MKCCPRGRVLFSNDAARGRNVCLYWLLDVPCKFSQDKCVYAHDRRFLPSGWWDFSDAFADYKEMISFSLNRRTFMPAVASVIRSKYEKREYGSRRDVKARHASKKAKGKGKARHTMGHAVDAQVAAFSGQSRGRGGGRGNGWGRGEVVAHVFNGWVATTTTNSRSACPTSCLP